MRIAVLPYRHMFNIRNSSADRVQARFNGERRESAEMLAAVEALLHDGQFNLPLHHDPRRHLGMEKVYAQNQHELAWSPPTFIPHSGHWFELELCRAGSIKAGASTARLCPFAMDS